MDFCGNHSPASKQAGPGAWLGHVDFFKNNAYFSRTNRRMVESASGHYGRMMTTIQSTAEKRWNRCSTLFFRLKNISIQTFHQTRKQLPAA